MEWLIDFYRPLSAALGMSTGASDSLLHVHGGMVVLFLARIATRPTQPSLLAASTCERCFPTSIRKRRHPCNEESGTEKAGIRWLAGFRR